MATSNSSVLPRITWSGFDRAPNVARNACSSGRRSLPSSGRQPDWASRPRAMPSTRRSKIWATSAPESRVHTGGIDSARAVSVSPTSVSSGPLGAYNQRPTVNGPSWVIVGRMRPLDTVRRASAAIRANHAIESDT